MVENRAKLALIVVFAIALGSVVTFGVLKLNAPKPVIISDALNVPVQLPALTLPPQNPAQSSKGGATAGVRAPRAKRVRKPKNSTGRKTPKKIKFGTIDINTATLDELEELPGVGPSTAQAIIDFRTQAGGFRSPDELGDIPRMGKKKLAKLLPFVSL